MASDAPLQALIHFKQPAGDGQQVKQLAKARDKMKRRAELKCLSQNLCPTLEPHQVHGVRFVSASSITLARGGR